jgi:pyruvate/2-oxoglutarate dehydrogenase complex dihydrolipoamide dehydrogenase (E3) component
MDEQFDFVIIGAGSAGEAAASLARARAASVAVIERELVGGSCPFWSCMPSKALLHAAAIHAIGGDYDWTNEPGHDRRSPLRVRPRRTATAVQGERRKMDRNRSPRARNRSDRLRFARSNKS